MLRAMLYHLSACTCASKSAMHCLSPRLIRGRRHVAALSLAAYGRSAPAGGGRRSAPGGRGLLAMQDGGDGQACRGAATRAGFQMLIM
jgi:hypothetical protein